MADIRSFRLRLLSFFLLVGLGVIAVIGAAIWLAAHRIGADAWPDMEKGLALGADDYVTKPFSTRALADKVRAMLGQDETGDG